MVAMLARYASRFAVCALDLTVDSSLLWVGTALVIVAAVNLAYVLAYVPRGCRRPNVGRIGPVERERTHHQNCTSEPKSVHIGDGAADA